MRRVLMASLLSAVVGAAADRTQYYDITGTSAAELRAALNRSRLMGSDGKPHDAFTKWDVKWRYTTNRSGGVCAVTSLDVTLETVMTLPRWTNQAGAPAALAQQWRTYFAALLVHEEGHKRIASEATAAIRSIAVPSQSNCDAVGQAVNNAANALLEQYRQKERQYDVQTDHGRTQGARFP